MERRTIDRRPQGHHGIESNLAPSRGRGMPGHGRALSTLGSDGPTLVRLRRSHQEMEIHAIQPRAAAGALRRMAMGQQATARDVLRVIPPYIGETGIMTASSGTGLGSRVASNKAACNTARPSNVKSVMSSKRDERWPIKRTRATQRDRSARLQPARCANRVPSGFWSPRRTQCCPADAQIMWAANRCYRPGTRIDGNQWP